MEIYLKLQSVVNQQMYHLKKLNYSLDEINQLNIHKAKEHIKFLISDEMLWHSELLQSCGYDVFNKDSNNRYKEYFDNIKHNLLKDDTPIKGIIIPPNPNFLEG